MSVIYTSSMIIDGHAYSCTYGSNGTLASQICVDPYNQPLNPDLPIEQTLVAALTGSTAQLGTPSLATLGEAIGYILKRLINQ